MFLAFLAHTARKSAKRWPLRLSKRWQAQSYFVYMYTYMPREWFTRCQTFMLGICKWAWFTIALSSSYIALLPIPTPTFFSIDFLAFSLQMPKSVIILMFWRMGPKPIWSRIHLFKTAWLKLISHFNSQSFDLLILNFQKNWRSVPKSNAITVRIRPYCAYCNSYFEVITIF